MKFEVLSQLVLRLVLGTFILIHSLYTLAFYKFYEKGIENYFSNFKLIDSELLLNGAPLFPFLEIIISTLLLLGIWLRLTILCSFCLIGLIATVHFLVGDIEILSIMAFILAALVIILRVFQKNEDFNVLDYPSITTKTF